MVRKGQHDVFQLRLRHLTVANSDSRLRYQPSQLIGHLIDAPDTIVDYKGLAVPLQLSAQDLSNHLVVLLQHIRLHRITVLDGFIQSAHTANSRKRHMKRTGNRGG